MSGRGRKRKALSPRRRSLAERGKVAVIFDRDLPQPQPNAWAEVEGWRLPIKDESTPRDATAKDRLAALFLDVGAPALLAGVSFYRFTGRGQAEQRRIAPWLRTEQFHIEMLLALALSEPAAWHPGTATRGQIDAAEQSLNAFVDALLPDVESEPEGLPRLARGDTRFVRTRAGPAQMLRLMNGLFQPVDDTFEVGTGFRLTQLVDLIERLKPEYDKRFRRFVAWHNDLVKNPVSMWPELRRRYWPEPALEPSQGEDNTTADSDRFERELNGPLPLLFKWSEQELASLAAIGRQAALRQVLDTWSILPGELNRRDVQRWPLDNPVWTRPIVHLPEGYFIPFPMLLYSFAFQLLEAACATDETTHKRYTTKRWRSRFLERRVLELFQEAFPGATLKTDNRFPGGQNDLICKIDNFMLVIEAKSAKVPLAARRGGPASLHHTMRDIAVEGSRQAYRFIDFLQAAQRRGVPATLADGTTIAVEDVVEYIPCVVHLESLGSIAADSKRTSAAFDPDDVQYTPAMLLSLADLETVFEILQTQEQRLHYLYRRRQLELRYRYTGDEMDLLGMYFDNQLVFDERVADGTLFLTGRSRPIDRWLSREQEMQAVARPRRRMAARFEDALGELSRKRNPGWTRIALALQDVPDHYQRRMEDVLRRLTRRLRRDRESLAASALIEVKLPEGSLKLSAMAHRTMPRSALRQIVQGSVSDLSELEGAREVVVMAVDVEAGAFPYSMVSVGINPWGDAMSDVAGAVLG